MLLEISLHASKLIKTLNNYYMDVRIFKRQSYCRLEIEVTNYLEIFIGIKTGKI
jgi:hypothetical protein